MVSQVYRTNKIGDNKIIQSKELTNKFQIKYNDKIYYREVLEFQTVHENTSFFYI